jgi:hypothetical protein
MDRVSTASTISDAGPLTRSRHGLIENRRRQILDLNAARFASNKTRVTPVAMPYVAHQPEQQHSHHRKFRPKFEFNDPHPSDAHAALPKLHRPEL